MKIWWIYSRINEEKEWSRGRLGWKYDEWTNQFMKRKSGVEEGWDGLLLGWMNE